MNIWEIVKTVGPRVLDVVAPGAGVALQAVNAFLPDDKKLPADATGTQLETALRSLPPEAQAEISKKEFDVDITQIKESYSTVRTMLEQDAQNPHTTRPYIAKGAFHVISFVIIITIALWSYGIYKSDTAMVKTIVDGWPFILATIGPFVVLLHAYFGILKQEHKQRMDAANGAANPSGIAGILSAFLKR